MSIQVVNEITEREQLRKQCREMKQGRIGRLKKKKSKESNKAGILQEKVTALTGGGVWAMLRSFPGGKKTEDTESE